MVETRRTKALHLFKLNARLAVQQIEGHRVQHVLLPRDELHAALALDAPCQRLVVAQVVDLLIAQPDLGKPQHFANAALCQKPRALGQHGAVQTHDEVRFIAARLACLKLGVNGFPVRE